MKIGLVTACYKPVLNGVTQMVSLYKQHLTDLGHEVTIFTLGEPDPEGDEPGVVRSPAIPLGDTGYYFGFRYSRDAQRLLRQMDIVHCHHLVMSMELAYRYSNCPIVYTNHTRYDLYAGSVASLPQPTADAMMRQIWPHLTEYCDVVIAPSAGIRQIMREFGVERPIVLIENGIELSRYWSPPAPKDKRELGYSGGTVLGIYVGRLSAEKRVDILLQQFAYAHQVQPTIRLLLVGDGPQRQELEETVRKLGLDRLVRFAGRIPAEEVPNYLAAADFFATASISEVHPLTVIEAMASGLAPVAISSPGIDETIEHGETGYVVSAAAAMSSAMVALVASEERRLQMGAAARIASRKYDIRDTVDRTVALYEQLLEARPDVGRNSQILRLPESISEGLRPMTAPFSKFWREQYLDVIEQGIRPKLPFGDKNKPHG